MSKIQGLIKLYNFLLTLDKTINDLKKMTLYIKPISMQNLKRNIFQIEQMFCIHLHFMQKHLSDMNNV